MVHTERQKIINTICERYKLDSPEFREAVSLAVAEVFVMYNHERRMEDAATKARAEAREEAAQVVEAFDDWVRCGCSECRADARSHAVDTAASMKMLAAQIRATEDKPAADKLEALLGG